MVRRLIHTALAATLSFGALVAASPALAAPPVVPMQRESVLTDAERELALASMSRRERGVMGPWLADGAHGLAVSYIRRQYRIDPGPDGGGQPIESVPAVGEPGSALTLPRPTTASASYTSKPGTDLTISFLVMRTRASSPYEWLVVPYAEWSGLDGMNATNSSADTLAVAWAGDAYLYRQSGSGQRIRGWPCSSGALDIWESDGSPNTGTAWSFHEWGWWSCAAWWASAEIRIRHRHWRNRTDNLVFKYYHTYSGSEYSFSFSRNPGITISPTSQQWALTLFGTYDH